MKKYSPLSLKGVKSYSLCARKSKVSVKAFAEVHKRGGTFAEFLENLPDVLAVKDLRAVAGAIVSARQKDRPVILGMGAHPIKLGLSPVIVELVKRNIITAIATNGACVVHDFEISLVGHTSEDVAMELCSGSFGMAQETGRGINLAISRGVKKGYGIGKAVGEHIAKGRFPFRDRSIFANAYRADIPATVHVAIGTDIVHMHPEADGSAIGKGSMADFRLLASVISDMEGGVYINLGSAVILPEVFLKALNIARNLGNRVADITTVNMDFIQHYRPRENVLKRPTSLKGRNYALTGHHEIMFPLLAAAVIEESK
ncbi:MAG: deoxyhypusine synthase family protein [Nitrospirae bacterium]|nr:deoxyhypusine synthase family protein [Nitrospirota bacterium]